MSMMIKVPDEIEPLLRRQAAEQQLSAEEFAIHLLTQMLGNESHVPTVEDVVARIKALPHNPHLICPAQGDLAEVLRDTPGTEDFDITEWERA